MCASFDLHLGQLNAKTTFLHEKLKKKLSEGLVERTKRTWFTG